MSSDYVKVQRRPLMELLTCPLCPNLYREATTICVCLHTFCKQCIYRKLEDDKRNHCPVCNAYLGSFPEELLRNDHNLRELVMQIFPQEKTSSVEEKSEGKRNHNDERDDDRYNHLIQTANKRSNHSMNAIKKQNELTEMESPHAFGTRSTKKGPCWAWEHLEGHEEGETYKSILNKTKGPAKLKRRRTKRKRCKFPSSQRKDGSKIWTEKQMPKPCPTDVGMSLDSGKPFGETVLLKELPGYSSRRVWFRLLACQERKGMALPQLPKPFISTKQGDLAVSFVNKYLAKKLNLKHESEVEVMCFGLPLVPTLTLTNLIDMWVEAVSNMGPVLLNCNAENSNGGNFVMELTYRRTNKK